MNPEIKQTQTVVSIHEGDSAAYNYYGENVTTSNVSETSVTFHLNQVNPFSMDDLMEHPTSFEHDTLPSMFLVTHPDSEKPDVYIGKRIDLVSADGDSIVWTVSEVSTVIIGEKKNLV